MTLQIPGSHRQSMTAATPVHWDFLEDSFSKCLSSPKPLLTLSKASLVLSREELFARPSYWELETIVNLVSPPISSPIIAQSALEPDCQDWNSGSVADLAV